MKPFLACVAILSALGLLGLSGCNCSPSSPAAARSSPTSEEEPGSRSPALADSGPSAAPGTRHALLVGVTKYDHLRERQQLRGPANDVLLFQALLRERFGFQQQDIVILSEAAAAAGGKRPTYANIRAEFDRLAREAKAGHQVVILLSGHGTQLPDGAEVEDPEPDGMDEAFCPADVAPKTKEQKTVLNVIIDDDLRQWLTDITQTGAFVWLIADCCHSGTVVRATDQEVPRKLKPEDLGISEKEITAAEQEAARVFGRTRGPGAPESALKIPGAAENLVAIYACSSVEETPELPLPRDSEGAKHYGLLTYTLCQHLTQARGGTAPTYRSLVERIRDSYEGMRPFLPIPLLEGKQQNRAVLGDTEWRSMPFRLTGDKQSGWRVNAGLLHGLTPGTVLAVYEGENADKPTAHARIKKAETLHSEVEAWEYPAMRAATADLPAKGRCDPVYVDYGDFRLKVAASQPDLAAEVRKLAMAGRATEAGAKGPFDVVDDARSAHWLVTAEQGQLFLVPAEGVSQRGGKSVSARFGPFSGDKRDAELKSSLARIARAQHLLRLAQLSQGDLGHDEEERSATSSGVKLKLELLRFKNEKDAGEVVERPANRELSLQAGDLIAVRLHNLSRNKIVFPTVLFVDSAYKTHAFYPDVGEVVEELKPGKTFTTDIFRVTANTVGLEHIVVIAVKAGREPVDFVFLAEETVQEAKRRSAKNPSTPLSSLFQYAVFGEGATRGAEKAFISDHAIRTVSWRTLASHP